MTPQERAEKLRQARLRHGKPFITEVPVTRAPRALPTLQPAPHVNIVPIQQHRSIETDEQPRGKP